MKRGFKLFFLKLFLNIILNPIFIFGYGFVPAMGMTGIGVATIISQTIALLILLIKITKYKILKRLSIKNFYPNFLFLSKIFFQSAPISAALFMISIGNFIILAYASRFGEPAIAGYGAATRFEQILLLPVLGLNTAIISIVGQNFGAKRFDRLNSGFKFAAQFTLVYAIFCIVFLYMSAEFFLGFFTSDPEVIRIAKIQLIYCPWGYGFLGLAAICNGSFNAFGKPMPAMIISISRTLIIYVPMAYFLASLFGIRGVFIAQVLANILAGVVGVIWYRLIFRQLSTSQEQT